LEIREEIVIYRDIKDVYDAYYDVRKWKTILSDVISVDIINTNGLEKEFYMTVKKMGKVETVHSKWQCIRDVSIVLTQPVPPPQFYSMMGKWEFKRLQDNRTKIVATRSYEILNEYFSQMDLINLRLRESLKKNLLHFKMYLEYVGIIEVNELLPLPVDKVKSLFWKIREWNKIWNPIQNVEVLYDNKLIQRFIMDVKRDNQIEKIETIRYFEDNKISFYSIDMPPRLDVHHGYWLFEPSGEETLVVAGRTFMMQDKYMSSFSKYKEDLQNRIGNILKSFYSYLTAQTK